MTDKKKNGWIKFVPSLDLPKGCVSIAYDTHDERGVRYAYGYFQFYNGTCGCFWKDGNEQPKVVKVEDIKYWMPVPSFDVQEEPVSEQNLSNVERTVKDWKEEHVSEDTMTIRKEWFDHCKESWYNEGYIDGKYNRDRQFEDSVSEDLEKAAVEIVRKELIDKAVGWIKEINNHHHIMRYSDSCEPPLSELIEWFKNFMKEENINSK